MSHTNPTFYPQLIVTQSVAEILEVGDIINGIGIPIDSEVLNIVDLGSGQWSIVIDQTPLEADVYATGNHGPYTDPSGAASARALWSTDIEIERPTAVSPTISFSEKVGGWVSLKSFGSMQMGISLANNYYTFHQGRLWLHYSETEDRNTFYGQFTASSIDVLLNQNPGEVKVFDTLNYEGSQAKVDKFTFIDGEDADYKKIPFQKKTSYSDQEYYNLYGKNGWSVESIITNKEEGYVNEFLEKEGKWFNGINKIVDALADANTYDFTFQGIGITAGATRSDGKGMGNIFDDGLRPSDEE